MKLTKLMKKATRFNIVCTVHDLETNLQIQTCTYWNVLYTATQYRVYKHKTPPGLYPYLAFEVAFVRLLIM